MNGRLNPLLSQTCCIYINHFSYFQHTKGFSRHVHQISGVLLDFFFLISKGERNIQTYKTSYYLGYMCTGIGVPFSTSQNQVIKPKKGGINEDKNVTLSLLQVTYILRPLLFIWSGLKNKQSQQLFSFHYDINMLQMGKIVKFYLKCHIQHSKDLSQETCFIDFWLELPLYSYVQLLSGQ